jgi:hypothetical protein
MPDPRPGGAATHDVVDRDEQRGSPRGASLLTLRHLLAALALLLSTGCAVVVTNTITPAALSTILVVLSVIAIVDVGVFRRRRRSEPD